MDISTCILLMYLLNVLGGIEKKICKNRTGSFVSNILHMLRFLFDLKTFYLFLELEFSQNSVVQNRSKYTNCMAQVFQCCKVNTIAQK